MLYGPSIQSPADQIIGEFVTQLLSVDQDFFLGLYLTGSITLNDFYPNKSDVDFLITCTSFPDEHMIKKLRKVHRDLAGKYPKPDLSGYYVRLSDLSSTGNDQIETLTCQYGLIHITKKEITPVLLFEIKSHAITVFGTEARELPVQIDIPAVNDFMRDNINSYWKNWIHRHSSWFNRRMLLILFPRLTEWSVLGVARQLCTLKTGKIVSKTAAGYFCLQQLPEQFHPIIREAIEIRKDDRSYPLLKTYAIRLSFRRAKKTIECVNAVISAFNRHSA